MSQVLKSDNTFFAGIPSVFICISYEFAKESHGVYVMTNSAAI